MLQEMIRNPFIYIFNWNIAETVYLALKNEFYGIRKNKRINKEKFWEHTISIRLLAIIIPNMDILKQH